MKRKDQLVDEAHTALKKLAGAQGTLVVRLTAPEIGDALIQVYGGLMRMQKREIEGLVLVLTAVIERQRGGTP